MSTSPPGHEPWQRWAPDAGAGLALLLVGLWEAHRDLSPTSALGAALVVVGLATAVAVTRGAPGAALALAWLVGGVHLVTGTGSLVVEVALVYVAFGCARWGSALVLWLSGASIPLGAMIAVLWIDPNVFYDSLSVAGVQMLARSRYYSGGDTWRISAGLLAIALLAAPWLLGLALRFSARSEASRRSQVAAELERDQAAEIARLRDEQTRLAHDVHDVVGHSLAVILAQAEAAQFRDDDPVALKETMATIATSARTSLDDVRQVLAATPGSTAPPREADLDTLIDGVRASGHTIQSTVIGTPQPMPPELGAVAFRTLQEMLTNAIKHGRRDEPVRVERHWEGDLRLEVQNDVPLAATIEDTQPLTAAPPPSTPVSGGGQGLVGMRSRLESVGGRLDVRRRSDPPTFTATAWIPVRASR